MKQPQKIFYLQAGTGKKTVVLLHGVMIQKEYTVISPDLPEFGLSTGFSYQAYQPGSITEKIQVNQITKNIEAL